MSTVAFIFARGGSKGLPGKNVKPLGGTPLIGHSVLMAKRISQIKKVYVSTDSEEIASVAKKFGAEIIRRPAELATDTASEWLAWQHAIQYVRDQGEDFQTFISLPTTAPLRSEEDVTNCLNALTSTTDVVVTVTPASRSPYFNMLVRDADGFSHKVIEGSGFVRRQDAPEVFDMTTVAYVSRPEYIMGHGSIFEGRMRSVVIPKERAIDVDDPWDFMMAEAIYEKVTGELKR